MTPERLREIEAVFHAALERDTIERPAVLQELCGMDLDLLKSVQALLSAEQSNGRLLKLVESTAELAASNKLIGQRLGAYQILREIGQGGMGAVYLAERVDDVYTRQVAIKLVKAGWTSSFVQERFRVERQILANLDHPFIARLLDGGATFDGRPYLVMEFVDGQPITHFAEKNRLAAESRVQIFCRICEAVEYAHQNLVIHRDLKPSNIIINADGVPKLLDFGIARLLDAEESSGASASFGWRLFTPEYASPEQFRGERVTTATDVYSLGATLYVLLTGHGPYALNDLTFAETERVVCGHEPQRPSLRNPELKGRLGRDLDTIVLKAMRKIPRERYASVGDLRADLLNALGGGAVQARDYTVVERAARLVRRNRLSFVAGTLIAASLLIGTIVSVRAASRAERERMRAETERIRAGQSAELASSQRVRAEASEREAEMRGRDAVRERGRAEASLAIANARLKDEHRLTTEVLLGINESLLTVPGATAVRDKAVKASAEYLDRLVKESDGNTRFQRDLAMAYARLAELTGNPTRANRGDVSGALALYERAKALVNRLLTQEPGNPALRHQLAAIQTDMIGVLSYLGRSRESQEEGKHAVTLFLALVRERPDSVEDLTGLANCYVRMLQSSNRFNDRAQVIHYAGLAREAYEKLARLDPQALQPKIGLADALSEEASADMYLGNRKAALASALEALRMWEQLRAEHPNNRVVLEGLMFSYGRLGDISNLASGRRIDAEHGPALEYFGKAREVASLLARQDSENRRAHFDLAVSGGRLGEALADSGEHEQAANVYRESVDTLVKLAAADKNNAVVQMYLAVHDYRMGEALRSLGRRDEAIVAYQKAIAVSRPLVLEGDKTGASTSTYASARLALAIDAAERGDRTAEAWTLDALTTLDKFAATVPATHPTAVVRPCIAAALAGKVYEALAAKASDPKKRDEDLKKALLYFASSTESWTRMPEKLRERAGKSDREALEHAQQAVARLSEAR